MSIAYRPLGEDGTKNLKDANATQVWVRWMRIRNLSTVHNVLSFVRVITVLWRLACVVPRVSINNLVFGHARTDWRGPRHLTSKSPLASNHVAAIMVMFSFRFENKLWGSEIAQSECDILWILMLLIRFESSILPNFSMELQLLT